MEKPDPEYIVYNLKRKDIEIIKSDLELTQRKTKILYFIDSFDVVEFAFPSLLSESGGDGRKAGSDNAQEYIDAAQKYLAYDTLFVQSKSLPLITKEYQLELRSLLHELKLEVSRYQGFQQRENFLAHFQSLSVDPKVLRRKISMLIVYAIGFMNDRMFERVRDFVSNPRSVIPKVEDRLEQEALEDILLDTKPTARVKRVFEMFCKREDPKLSRLAPDAKEVYLENTHRDIEVIDRIFEINDKVNRNERVRGKYAFQYLSSSPYKSPIIFDLFAADAEISQGRRDTDSSFLRNINHFAVLDGILSRRRFSPNDDNVELTELLNIGQLNDDRRSVVRQLPGAYKRLSSDMERSIGVSRESLENTYAMYKLCTEYGDRAKLALEELQRGSNNNLEKLIDDLFSYLEKDRSEKEKVIIALDNYSDINWIHGKMLRFFFSAGRHKGPERIYIKVYGGLDVIRSHIQLYPVLLFHKVLTQVGKGILNDLLLHVASPISHSNDFIVSKYVQVQDHEFFALSNFERKIFYLLLQLILPLSPHESETIYPHAMTDERLHKELEIINSLERIWEVNEKRLVGYVPVEDSEGQLKGMEIFFYPPKTVRNEIAYFLAWMYRRVRNYKDCYRLVNECLADPAPEAKDPRLYHGRALSLISEAYEQLENNQEKSLGMFTRAMEDLKVAKEGFAIQPGSILLKHIVIGIDNTICVICIELYLLIGDNNEFYINEMARPLLNDIKSRLLHMNERYDLYPSYNHTEADLEFCEAIIFYKRRQLQEAKAKIENSVKRLSIIDDSKLLHGYSYLSNSRRRITKLAKRMHKNNLRSLDDEQT